MLLPLIPTFAFADSLCGGRPQVPGRGIYYVALAAIAAFALHFLYPIYLLVAGLLAAFIVWREPAWWNGSLAPTPDQIPSTILRHALSFAFVIPLFFVAHVPVATALVGMGAFTAISTGLAVYNRKSADKGKDVNNIIEPVRGGILGIIIMVLLTFGTLTV